MKKTPYSIQVNHTTAVITLTTRNRYNEEIHEYMEISCDLDTATIAPRQYHDEIDWNHRIMNSPTDALARWANYTDAARIITPEAIDSAKTAILKNIDAMKRQVKHARRHPAYAAMKHEALNTIRHFETDFTFHDCIRLDAMTHNVNFLWMIRPAGTWLITDRNDWHNAIMDLDRKEKNHTYYYWNGIELKKIPAETAREIYARMKPANAPVNADLITA